MKKIYISLIILILVFGLGWVITKKNSSTFVKETAISEIQQNTESKTLHQATMKIEGMWCASCATGAEYSLKDKQGVIDATIDYGSETGIVIYDPTKISHEELIKAVEPYTASIIEDKVLEDL